VTAFANLPETDMEHGDDPPGGVPLGAKTQTGPYFGFPLTQPLARQSQHDPIGLHPEGHQARGYG
jgi:hypothetical protein